MQHHAVNALFGILKRVIASKCQAVFGRIHERKYKSGFGDNCGLVWAIMTLFSTLITYRYDFGHLWRWFYWWEFCSRLVKRANSRRHCQFRIFGDNRGWFAESFNAHDFAKASNLHLEFVQDNHSFSR